MNSLIPKKFRGKTLTIREIDIYVMAFERGVKVCTQIINE